MRSQGSDGIDFKPFFDLIVGVLFILLILIAAQLFFSQYSAPDRHTNRAKNQFTWDEEALQFLQETRNQLANAQIPSQIDPQRRAVLIPLEGLLQDPSTLTGLKSSDAAAIARVLNQTAGCLEPSRQALAFCPKFELLKRGRAVIGVILDRGTISGFSGEESARLIATGLLARMIESEPALVRHRGADQSHYLALVPDMRIITRPAAGVTPTNRPGGFLELKFEFGGL